MFNRYRDLQSYVGWTEADQRRILDARSVISPHFVAMIEDFYDEIQRHPNAFRVLTGGQAQIERLKQSLLQWLSELWTGPYNEAYIARRWRVGMRHAEIGLPQAYTVAALSRLRNRMVEALRSRWASGTTNLLETIESLNKLLDMDLAIIGDAYETEYVERQREAERKQLDDVLHREKELASGLLTHAQAAVLILDQGGGIVRCNPFTEALAAEMLELPAGLEAQDWAEAFLPPEERERVRRELFAPPAAGGSRALASSTLRRGDRVRQLRWVGSPLLDGAGRPFGALVIGHDVSDLVDAQRRALQSERLAAIGQMATGLAHESRNSLQRIGASAEMLEQCLENNSPGLELLGRIQQSKNHLHLLLEEVRNYAAPIVLDRSPIRISEAWREAWELLSAPRRAKQAKLHEEMLTERLTVNVDRFRMVQVFRNLLENALAAGTDEVHIAVKCELVRHENADALRVSLRDNGCGLTAEQRRRIFEPFYTTKPTGTGLGTAIAQRLIEAHGGTIAVGECAPPGTEIVVVLPVCADASPEQAATSAA